ncbi:MAG TPA: SCP2 sterol-binding domain-containing protein [Acidimicrobiales bacterium]
MRYLGPEWMDAARRALAEDERLAERTTGVRLTLEQAVDAGPDGGEIRWHIVIDDGSVTLAEGPAQRFDVRFTTSYDTAAQIATGRLSAQRAFVDGRLRIGGDLTVLVAHQRALASLEDVFADLRRHTSFPPP